MQKYQLSRQTHEKTIVLGLKLYKILLYTAIIAYENTYDSGAKLVFLSMLSNTSAVCISNPNLFTKDINVVSCVCPMHPLVVGHYNASCAM